MLSLPMGPCGSRDTGASDAEAVSEDLENLLAGDGYRRPFGIFNANQDLVKKRRVVVPQTRLVEFREEATQQSLAAMIKQQSNPGRTQRGRISISESWTDEALRFLRRERYPDREVKLAALNYANCSYPGGNYSDGGMTRAQEEELCRQFPALFESLKSCKDAGSRDGGGLCQYRQHVFGARRQDPYGFARNVLFTEEVRCMRGPAELSYRLLRSEANQVEAGFVAAAAPTFGRGHDALLEHWRTNPEEWYEKLFLNVFCAPKAADPKYDVIVVGPWGCGAFGNDPRTVAQSFLNVIEKHDVLRLYREIHFCMGRSLANDTTVGGACNRNVETFRKVLGSAAIAVEDYTQDLQAKAATWLGEEVHLDLVA